MEISDIVFLLGEQASGKSTIAKLIYFFRTFQEEFVSLVYTSEFDDWQRNRHVYFARLRSKFTGTFGLGKGLGRFEIQYTYSSERYVKVTAFSVGEIGFDVSMVLQGELQSIWKDAKEMQQVIKEGAASKYASIIMEIEENKDLVSRLKNAFNDDADPIYIPAGRALLSRQMLLQLIQGDELRRINQRESHKSFDILDTPTRAYIDEVSRIRGRAYRNDQYIKNDPSFRFLDDTAQGILKGAYTYANDSDYIRLNDQTLVPIPYSASGQQEVVWLLNLLRYYAEVGQRCFIVVEEPEAHLHPDAQYLLAKFIAAFRNITNSQIFITTHSPYILTSFNNLFYADKCGKESENSEAAHRVIPKQCWLRTEDFSAYMLEEGTTRDLKDEELAMVDIAELDAVASEQDTEYEELLSIRKRGVSD